MNQPSIERQQVIKNILSDLRGIEPLKKLIWSELNYSRVNEPISKNLLGDNVASMLEDEPILFASGGQDGLFNVIYTCLPDDHLYLTKERAIVTKLLREKVQYGLFIFSNAAQEKWHFVNVRIDEKQRKTLTEDERKKPRLLFRRITIGPDERLRTATNGSRCLI